jgi:hypothetical protein
LLEDLLDPAADLASACGRRGTPVGELSLLFGNCGKAWLALQPGFAAASAHPEMGLAEAMHYIAFFLALMLLLSTSLPFFTPLAFSLSSNIARERGKEGLVDGRDEHRKRQAKTKRVAFWDAPQLI